MKRITKLAIACILCTLFVCGGVSADSSVDKLCVGFSGDIGYSQYIYLWGVSITDCDGNHFYIVPPPDPEWWDEELMRWHNEDDSIVVLNLIGLNCDKPFKEVKLHLTLERSWGFCWCYCRYDKFTLNVTDLVTKTEYGPNTVKLKADNLYEVSKADAVYICDRDNNVLKYFAPTHKDGHYGSWDI